MPSETSWILFASNDEAWKSILDDCAQAEESIDLEQFIFVNDDFGKKLIDVCAERAAVGVQVRFMWDAAGSFSFLGSGIIDELKKKGIKLVFWKTLVPSYFKVPNYRSWFLRNHRRTLVIDKVVGYTGSICVQERMKNWRDTNVRLVGPVVGEMQSAFDRMWLRAQGTKRLPARVKARDPQFRYITNQPGPGRHHIYTNIVDAIRGAEKYIYITTPYFVPTHRLARAIALAAYRGVDVRLIIPESSDYYAVDLGARSYFTMLLRAGVRIFLYSGRMIHCKSVAVDGTWSTIGSLNLDRASLLYNYEANVVSTNDRFAEELAGHFMNDLKDTREITLTEWKDRFFLEKILVVLIRLVRQFL